MQLKHAMVLAAGRGERMRPLTDVTPKPLIPVNGKSLIDYTLDMLESAGVEEVVVNASYLAEQVTAHVDARQTPHVQVSHEPERLETGGGIAKALPLLGNGPFYSFNSDIILLDGARPGLECLADAWDDASMDALLLLVPVERATGYEGEGDFFYDGAMLKRRGEAGSAPYAFSGVQIIHPRLFADVPEGPFSLNLLYDRQRDTEGCLPNIKAVIHDGGWLHVGTPEQKESAEARLKSAA